MTIQEAIQARHSVRQYIDKPITEDVVTALNAKIDEVNAEAGLHIQLVLNEPKSFQCAMAKYGRFSGVNSYLVMAGKKTDDLDEKIGYYGEQIVLLAPTAVNQQKFFFEYTTGNKVIAKRSVSLVGYTQMDLGIVKYHFEVGAGKENFEWSVI